MKPAVQLLVTVLLVAGGIFVYDATVERSPAVPPELIERGADPAEDPADPRFEAQDSAPSFPVLEGTGDDLWRADVDRRLAELEVGRTTAAVAEPGLPAESTEGAAEGVEGEGGDPTALDPEERKRVEQQRMKWFRGMLEKVERQRRWEQAARKVKQYFDKLDLALTDEQKLDAVRTTVHYQGRWRKLKQDQDRRKAPEQQRRDEYQTMWGEYQNALRDVLPAAEADVIVDALQNAGRKDGKR